MDTRANSSQVYNRQYKRVPVKVKASTFISMRLGQITDNYEILENIGKGTFSEVIKIRHKTTGQYRAVKKVNKQAIDREQLDSKSLLKEVTILKRLDHPNIIRLYEMYEDARSFYLVTEYCEGGELYDAILNLRRFNERHACEIMRQILSAVNNCHRLKIVHRDLKPENILMEAKEDQFNIKVADFGSSCLFESSNTVSGIFGSAYYIAPEVFTHIYNEKCDI